MKIVKQSVELLWITENPEFQIERSGRLCYKSEDNMTPESSGEFCEKMNRLGHHAMIEHASASFRIITDRGISHEIVRHRIASFAQESTRYCVAGDSKLSFKNPHIKMTIKELYGNSVKSKNGAWKRIQIRQLDEKTGEIIHSKIKNIFKNGVKDVVTVKTRLGYTITLTSDHLIKTINGYLPAKDVLHSKIATNGTDLLYKNRDWMFNQHNTLMKTAVEISKEFNFNTSTIKKWARKHGLPDKPRSYFNKGRAPWNKGVSEHDNVKVKIQSDALRKFHWDNCSVCDRLDRKHRIKKMSHRTYHKTVKQQCEICNKKRSLNVHHIDEDRMNNAVGNLITVCTSCHAGIHNRSNMVAFYDDVISVEHSGVSEVYDIEMDSENHNLIANGVCVHNCNYSADKFENQCSFIEPPDLTPLQQVLWRKSCEDAEDSYFKMLKMGCSAQIARSVLPTCLKTELVMTANFREWLHFIELRGSKAAHPQIRPIAHEINRILSEHAPSIFKSEAH